MPTPPTRPLHGNEAKMGLYVYALIYDWKSWVHRRVEQVTFTGTVTYNRRISIDLTIPRSYDPPLVTESEEPLFCLPVALLKKQRLRQFSLWDERGGTLPLLTRRKTGAVTTGALVAAARRVMRAEGESQLPPAIYDELWQIANGSPQAAHRVWLRFSEPRPQDTAEERRWRHQLTQSTTFRELTATLARNFLVLTVLRAQRNERRVLKMQYEVKGNEPLSRTRARRQQWRRNRRVRRARRAHRRMTDGVLMLGGHSRLTVVARGHRPGAGIAVAVRRNGAQVQATTTQRDGSASFALPPGTYFVVCDERARADEEHDLGPTDVRRGVNQIVHVTYRPAADTTAMLAGADDGGPIPGHQKFRSSVAWLSRRMVIATPSAGQASAYCLEVEAPEGLKLTRATLREAAPSVTDLAGVGVGEDVELGDVQRAHLMMDDVARNAASFASLHLRARASLMVRAGALSSLTTTLLLGLSTWKHSNVVGVAGALVALLLFVPSGLTSYTTRPRENQLTSSVAFGLRLLSLAGAALALLAASVILFGRTWSINTNTKAVQAGTEWGGTEAALIALTAASGIITVVLGLSWLFTGRPPERRVA